MWHWHNAEHDYDDDDHHHRLSKCCQNVAETEERIRRIKGSYEHTPSVRNYMYTWKKRSDTERRQKNCPASDPFPGAQDSQNLISRRRSLTLPIQTQFGEDRCTQFRVIVVTDPHTNEPTDMADYNTLRHS